MELTKEHKEFIDNNFHKIPDLIELTRAVFKDGTIDGRSKEGRAVRKYLVDNNVKYKTTEKQKVKPIMVRYSDDGMSSFQIAQVLFTDREIKNLGIEQRTVHGYLKAVKKQRRKDSREIASTYSPPDDIEECLDLVNLYSSKNLKIKELKVIEKKSIESLYQFLRSPRFNQIISNYTKPDDQNLFEAEFIRATWDKPDLTADEINLYINVCVDYINLKNIGAHIEKLNRMFEDADEQQDMTVRLAELLKTKSEEYNQCEKRQESLIQRLAGDRAKRVANRQDKNASILALVESFQNEEDRKLMVKMADMQKKAVEEEASNFESMQEWKARILGISKGDVI